MLVISTLHGIFDAKPLFAKLRLIAEGVALYPHGRRSFKKKKRVV